MHTDAELRPSKTREEHALENVRRLKQWNKQDTGLTGGLPAPRKIGSVGVIGAGTMGLAIAAAHAQCGFPVVLTDSDPAALASALSRVAAAADTALAGKGERGLVAPPIALTCELAAVAGCDLVLETITETLPAKQALYAQLAGKLGAETILASNTSTIPIGRLGVAVTDPSRFCGIHFCHPVAQRPLVEIVRGPKSSEACIATVVAHAKRDRQDANPGQRRAGILNQPTAVTLLERGPRPVARRCHDYSDRPRRDRFWHGQGTVGHAG